MAVYYKDQPYPSLSSAANAMYRAELNPTRQSVNGWTSLFIQDDNGQFVVAADGHVICLYVLLRVTVGGVLA